MPSAADKYIENINFFASLAQRTGTVKLSYNNTAGVFSVASKALFRTIANIAGSAADKQSVSNDAMFHDPIVAVFRAAADNNMSVGKRYAAFSGLETLRRQYKEQDKSAHLERTLRDIRQYVPRTELDELRDRFNAINPLIVLGPLDLEFLDTVWNDRGRLFRLLNEAERPEGAVNNRNRPYGVLADQIYALYNGHIEPEINDPIAWAKSLPALMSQGGMNYYHLQHSNVMLAEKKSGQMVSNPGYGSDFIYYTAGHNVPGQALWRIYLNFDAAAAADILTFLWGRGPGSGIHSFKIAGPLAFHTRKDKIVIYVSISGRDTLVGALRTNAAAFRLKDPLPGMTIKQAPGLAIGIEPSSLDTGFSRDLDPRKSRRQSYGSIRAQLIAAALTNMYGVIEDDKKKRQRYLGDKNVFLKWVAIAFQSYANALNPP